MRVENLPVLREGNKVHTAKKKQKKYLDKYDDTKFPKASREEAEEYYCKIIDDDILNNTPKPSLVGPEAPGLSVD